LTICPHFEGPRFPRQKQHNSKKFRPLVGLGAPRNSKGQVTHVSTSIENTCTCPPEPVVLIVSSGPVCPSNDLSIKPSFVLGEIRPQLKVVGAIKLAARSLYLLKLQHIILFHEDS